MSDDAVSRYQRGAGDRAESAQRRPAAEGAAKPTHPGSAGTPTDPDGAARTIVLRRLSQAPQTRAQLTDALTRKGIPAETCTAVLDRFTEVGLVDDDAFAAGWVESRQAGRGLARRALADELRGRGVAPSTVVEAVARVRPEAEEAAARRLVRARLPRSAGLPYPTRLRRLVGVLARKGYPEALAERVVRAELARHDDADDPDAASGVRVDPGVTPS